MVYIDQLKTWLNLIVLEKDNIVFVTLVDSTMRLNSIWDLRHLHISFTQKGTCAV